MKIKTKQIAFLTTLLLSSHSAFAKETEDNFDSLYQQELAELKNKVQELESKKQHQWHVDTYIGMEQEIDSNDHWKFINGSMATSPYFGAFIYQDNSLWMYDVQVLKTYIDHNKEYDRTRWQVGATRTFPFSDNKGNMKVRVGYRNDNWHFASIKNAEQAAPTYLGDLRKGEERNEFWLRPQFSYAYSDALNLSASFSFRFIDRKLDYARAKGQYGVYKRDWSFINEHFAGATYSFNKNQSLWLSYLYINENLINSLVNKEHFLWAMYRHKFDSGLSVMPYTRIALAKGKQSYRDSDNNEFLSKEKNRSRVGVQMTYPIAKDTSIFWDTYYRPEKTWTNSEKQKNNFWFWAVELRHSF